MMSGRPGRGPIDLGFGGPMPKDLLALLGVFFLTFTLSAFASTNQLMEMLRLGPDLWRQGYLWQLVTYPFIESYGAPIWFLVSLWMVFMFGRSVFFFVGRKAFWRHLFLTTLTAGLLAVAVQVTIDLLGWGQPFVRPLGLMSGSSVLLIFVITGFATLYSGATIYMMFVLPIQAKWYLALEAVFIFFAFLESRDFAGFVGLMTVLGAAYFLFSGRSPKRLLHEMRLRMERRVLEARLKRSKARHGKGRAPGGGRGTEDEGGVVQGPWVN